MKQYTSVLRLIAANSFYKCFTVLLLTFAAQTVAYYLHLKHALALYLERQAAGLVYTPPAMADGILLLSVPFGIGLILTTLLLLRFGTEKQSKTSYTLNRLSVNARTFFRIQSVYHTAVYLLFWMAEIVTVFSVALIYTNMMPQELVGDHTVFLAFYSDPFLHATLPLEDIVLLIRNIVVLLSLGICTAYSPRQAKTTAPPRISIILAVAAAFCWKNTLSNVSMPILLMAVAIVFAIFTIEFSIGLTEERRTENETENALHSA